MEYLHRDSLGRAIPLRELEMAHLMNIIEYIKRKANEGLTLKYGGGLEDADIWYDEETLFDKDVKRHLHYKIYKKELKRRLKHPAE